MLVTVLLYRKIARLWWTWDDAYLLHITMVHPARDHFFGSSIWLSVPQQLFTPLLTASYDAELALFGADPARFYIVHLAELALTVVALYVTLRFWMSWPAAACASILFIAGTPVCTMSTQLMLMHYMQSVLLAIVSVALFVAGLRREDAFSTIASGVVYLAALLAKEVAAPLPAILLILPERDPRTRLRNMWPHAVAIVVYFVWRLRILGKIVGGYAPFTLDEIPALVARTPMLMVRTFAGPRLVFGVPLLLLLLFGIAMRVRSRRDVLAIAVAFVAAIAPVLPAARWSYVAWLCVAVVFAAGIDSLRNRRLALGVLGVTALLALAVNRQAWASEFRGAMRMSNEGRVFADLGPGDLLRNPSIPPPLMFELEWLKENLLHRPAGSLWSFDDFYLCGDRRLHRVFSYDEQQRSVVEITPTIDGVAKRYCASLRWNEPLAVHFHYADEVLRWELGPHESGAYRVLLGSGVRAFDVARRDALRLTGLNSLTFRLRYQSPDGWVTYSPELTMELRQGGDLVWRR